MITIDLSKAQALDPDSKAMQQVNSMGKLTQDGNANATVFYIMEEAKETQLDFSNGTIKVP